MSLSGWVWVLVRVKQHLGSTSGQDLDTQSQVQHAAGARKCTGWTRDEKACSVGVFLTHLVGVRVPPTGTCLYRHIGDSH